MLIATSVIILTNIMAPILKENIRLLFYFLGFINISYQQDIGEIRSRIDQFANELIRCYDIPGLIVAAVRDNEV